VFLDRLPLTPNGKIDKKALPNNDQPSRAKEFVSPRTETEKEICSIVTEVLGLQKVCILDNFFEIGGHSLLAMQVVSRIQEKYNINVPVRTLFTISNIAELAEYIDTSKWISESEKSVTSEKTADREDVVI
jgi:acyl carrier protein